MGLEKYNAAPRVSDRATAEYTGFVVPRPSGSWSWSSDSFDILSHARSSRPKLAFSRDKRVAACRCAMCARVNPRSGTRKERHKGKPTEPFATQARKYPRSAFRCNPRSLTYPPSTSDTPHTTRTFFFFFSVLPTTDTPRLFEERCTDHAEGGRDLAIRPFTKMYCSSRRVLSRLISRRHHHHHHHHHHRGTQAAMPGADDFQWFPRFFNLVEQHALLSAALRKLDAAEPRASRKRRRDFLASRHQPTTQDHQRTHCAGVLEDSFLPDDLYHFEEVRHPTRFSFLFLFFLWASSRAIAADLAGARSSPRRAGSL